MPYINDMIDRLSGARVFSVLDISWSFWLVSLHPDSQPLTVFVTNHGNFAWRVVPMDIKNGVSALTRELRRRIGDHLGRVVDLYCDDLIVFTETVDQHRHLLSRLFKRLSDEGLRLKREKCKLFRSEVEYLGHKISAGRVRPSPTKVKAIIDFPTPKTVKDIQRFVGVVNFFRRFVDHHSTIVEPLTRLTRKDDPFVWTDEQQHAFDALKRAFASEPVLDIYDPSLPLMLQTDASGIGIGGVLWQRRNDELRPIA